MRCKSGFLVVPVVLACVIAGQAQPPMHAFKGTGDVVTPTFDVPGSIAIPCTAQCGLYVLVMKYAGQGNFIVTLLETDGTPQALAVNTIGSYSGSRLLSIPRGMYLFQIMSSGPWQMGLVAVDDKDATSLPYTYKATGDSPMGAVRLNAGLLRATLTHGGTSNFIVQLYHANGDLVGLVANTIGLYKGDVAQRIPTTGVYYLDVQATGDWSITLTQ
jgi:hypothetical protein